LSSGEGPERISIVVPVYNDWEPVRALLHDLDASLAAAGLEAHVVLVDDASTEDAEGPWLRDAPRAIRQIDVLTLRFNLGPQRAIAVGLCHVATAGLPGPTVVMDGDGEDRPSDVPRLWERFRENRGDAIVFAERRRRSEGIPFALAYHTYRGLHRLLTGISVRVGNFSILPRHRLENLVYVPDMWNHYAAAVFRSGLPFTTVATTRGTRSQGRSRMNWISLVTHGLSALAVFGERVGVRLMIIALSLILAMTAVLGSLLAGALGGDEPSAMLVLAAGLLLVLLFQVVTVAAALALFVLNSRRNLNSFPVQDYGHLVARRSRVYPDGD
jgi:glycosyltransferase involved in cell wall biosynthesis